MAAPPPDILALSDHAPTAINMPKINLINNSEFSYPPISTALIEEDIFCKANSFSFIQQRFIHNLDIYTKTSEFAGHMRYMMAVCVTNLRHRFVHYLNYKQTFVEVSPQILTLAEIATLDELKPADFDDYLKKVIPEHQYRKVRKDLRDGEKILGYFTPQMMQGCNIYTNGLLKIASFNNQQVANIIIEKSRNLPGKNHFSDKYIAKVLDNLVIAPKASKEKITEIMEERFKVVDQQQAEEKQNSYNQKINQRNNTNTNTLLTDAQGNRIQKDLNSSSSSAGVSSGTTAKKSGDNLKASKAKQANHTAGNKTPVEKEKGKTVLARPGTGRSVINFQTKIPVEYNIEVEGPTKTAELVLPGFDTLSFELKNMVASTIRFEQQPGFKNASQSANGSPYSVIPGLDTIYKDEPILFFDEKRVCNTVYIPGHIVMASEHAQLIKTISGILYKMLCEGKVSMTDVAKMASGPVLIKQFVANHRDEIAELVQKRKQSGIENPSANVICINSAGTAANIHTLQCYRF